MKYSPVPQKGKTTALAGILFAIALVSYVFSIMKITSPALLQLITLLAITAAVYVLVRFRYTTVTYMITPRGREEYEGIQLLSDIDFIVTKSQGRREGIMECRLSLDLLAAVVPLPHGQITGDMRRDLSEKFGKIKIYNYTVSMRPADSIALVFDDEGDVSVIAVEPDEVMRQYLEDAAARNGKV